MSLQISIEAYLDDAEVRKAQAELIATNEEIARATQANEKATKEAYDLSMSAMRAGYMVLTGMTQAMGGSMSQAFSAIYGIAMAGIQTYQSIAAALLPSPIPGARLMAGLMFASLATALVQLGLVAVGQEDFAQQIGGLNMMVQGIGGMISKLGF